jgi:hypothetical protein
MADGFNFAQLQQAILDQSESDIWDVARKEWRLASVYEVEEPERCLCGHFPIIEICVLRNTRNGQQAEVGNVCVQRFMGIDSTKIFQSIKRIRKDPSKSLSMDVVILFSQQGILANKDVQFYSSIHKKRNLTLPQANWKQDINKRVLDRLVRARLT